MAMANSIVITSFPQGAALGRGARQAGARNLIIGEEARMHEEVRPNLEPSREPFDPHLPPLDDDDDARFLDPIDARRREVEFKRGERFPDEE
jgi:hypothetical protein